jgi:hypothetical protein
MAAKKKPAEKPTKTSEKPTKTSEKPTTPATVAPVAPVTARTEVSEALPGFIDELGRLEAELAPYAQKIKRAELLRRAVREATPEWPAHRPLELRGAEYEAFLGPKANETIIDYGALVSLIGAEAFATFARTTQKDLFANVSNALHLALILTTEQTGPRPLKVFPRVLKSPASEQKAA